MNEEVLQNFVFLSDNYCVRLELYEQVLAIVREASDAMPLGCSMTVEELCGKDVWSGFSTGNRIIAGRCVAYAVERQLVELDFAVCRYKHPKRYVRRGDPSACFAKCSRFPR